MQGWQFDDLTRTLGKAASRRQVLKGLLGGLGAAVLGRSVRGHGSSDVALAAPGEVCDRQRCMDDATGLFKICTTDCNALSPRHGYRHQEKLACILGCTTAYEIEKYECQHNATGCMGNNACCDQQCVVIETDPKNCGSCGNVCPEGSTCIGGECHCQDGSLLCDGQCVNTRTDPHHCGDCDITCATCQVCRNGQCAPKHCPLGYVCCNDECVPLCPSGDAPDPGTCQCNVCQGQIDGAACDANDASKLCCQQQCVSNECPTGKTFSLDTCRCECSSTCPPGQLQDPSTCQCQDLCANVTCNECQTCDPTSGDCVQVTDQTSCGSGQVCCGGVCKDSCTGNQCPNGQYACAVTPAYNSEVVRPDYFCCDNESPCCGGNGYLYDVCQGSTYNGQHVCCAPGTNQCGSDCCDHNTQICLTAAADYSLHCCPAGSGDVLPDGTCCDAGEQAYPCTAGGWACCAVAWCCS